MNMKFIDELLRVVNALEIVGEPSSFTSKNDFEEEVGVIMNEETKKLFYYYSHVCRNKLVVLRNKILEYMALKPDGLVIKREEVEKLIKEVHDVMDNQTMAHIFFKKSLEEEIDLKHCDLIRITRGWKVVKPKCNECQNILSDMGKDIDKLMSTFSSKFSDKARFN